MSRNITTLQADLLEQQHVEAVNLVELDWPNGMVRVHSGLGKLTYAGNEYLGVGDLGAISSLSDTGEVGDTGISLTLSGLKSELVASVIDDDAVGCAGRVYLAILDEHSRLLDANVVPLFAGTIKRTPVRQGNSPQITVELVADAINRSKSKSWRYTDNSQQNRHSGDRIFRYVEIMADRPFYWGSKKDGLPLKNY